MTSTKALALIDKAHAIVIPARGMLASSLIAALAAWHGGAALAPRHAAAQPAVVSRGGHVQAAVGGGGGGGLARPGSQLEDALSALQPAEQYNAVLESLLARGRANSSNVARAIDLVGEMTSRRLRLTSGSLKALVDATASADGLPRLLEVFGAVRANGTPARSGPGRPSGRRPGPIRHEGWANYRSPTNSTSDIGFL